MNAKRFWKIEDFDDEGGFIFIEHQRIAVVFRDEDGDGAIAFESGELFNVREKDYQKIIAWAETESEEIPIVETSAQNYTVGGWK